ncbi:concanavalin A-like lectin/glucanase domain-containing protein [Paraphysoderma sedebokerense]|nr:concanavalin A-like lectin/glucanase domain-containing protein [Paraphysoderma sedebokerense]
MKYFSSIIAFLALWNFSFGYPQNSAAAAPKTCVIPESSDEFDNIDQTKWKFANELDGGRNWEFQWYSDRPETTFVQDGKLHIMPQLTADFIGEANMLGEVEGGNFTVNVGDKCTGSAEFFGCTRTATKNGNIINPIMSGKLTSKFTIKPNSRVEFKARLPRGDWLWPAMWLLPKNEVYGTWPRSGEIDVMESRGNFIDGKFGVKSMESTLHWGPSPQRNGFSKTNGHTSLPAGTFADDFHTYTLDWTKNGIKMSVDNKPVYSIDFNQVNGFYKFGEFGDLPNPWAQGSIGAPFDQEFYIILNVAVGGTNGFFPDDMPNKPWKNTDEMAARKFWEAKDKWFPTWPGAESAGYRALVIDYIRTTPLSDDGTVAC